MSGPPVGIEPDRRVDEAERLAARRGIRHLLVREGDRLLGVLCVCDLRKADPRSPVASCMRAPPLAVGPTASLAQAAEIMRDGQVGCLPVVIDGRAHGIVTRHDLQRAGWRDPSSEEGRCACCGRGHDLHAMGGVFFCLDCLEHAGPPGDEDDLGEGD